MKLINSPFPFNAKFLQLLQIKKHMEIPVSIDIGHIATLNKNFSLALMILDGSINSLISN